MPDSDRKGHRDRLRSRFLAGDEGAHSDERLLELLLTYAIPRRDVEAVADELIRTTGSLEALLAMDYDELCKLRGLGKHSAVLLKLVDLIRTRGDGEGPVPARAATGGQLQLLSGVEDATPSEGPPEPAAEPPTDAPGDAADDDGPGGSPKAKRRSVQPRKGTGLFGKSMLKDAIDLLPRLPDTESLDEIVHFLRQNLPYNSEQTRHRNTNYVVRRVFPDGLADSALRRFAVAFTGLQELREACFYRFCRAEPLMYEIIEELLLPALGRGQLPRQALRTYLDQRFPGSRSTQDCTTATLKALTEAQIVSANRKRISFGYRDVLIPSFAFVLHSEFPEPGMYDIGLVERNRATRAMLWQPGRLLPSLYELRNRGIISKVSEIDTVRQFSTKWTLDQVVDHLTAQGGSE